MCVCLCLILAFSQTGSGMETSLYKLVQENGKWYKFTVCAATILTTCATNLTTRAHRNMCYSQTDSLESIQCDLVNLINTVERATTKIIEQRTTRVFELVIIQDICFSLQSTKQLPPQLAITSSPINPVWNSTSLYCVLSIIIHCTSLFLPPIIGHENTSLFFLPPLFSLRPNPLPLFSPSLSPLSSSIRVVR